MTRSVYLFCASLLVALGIPTAISVTGCSGTTQAVVDEALDDAEMQFERARLLLTEEPSDAKTPTEVKETATEKTSLVIAGRIDAGEESPFQSGKATFMLSQLPDPGHGADDPDHADNCPFCKRELAKAPKVIVSFHDDNGTPLNMDAQKLFSVAKGDAVVVTGDGMYNEATNTVMLNADGLFRRKK